MRHLITTVEDIVHNDIAVLDVSAACHMPDVIEMPYRPPLFDSGEAKEKEYTYLLGGEACLAGDVIGSYSFDQPLKVGDRLTFGDMAIYTTVKIIHSMECVFRILCGNAKVENVRS